MEDLDSEFQPIGEVVIGDPTVIWIIRRSHEYVNERANGIVDVIMSLILRCYCFYWQSSHCRNVMFCWLAYSACDCWIIEENHAFEQKTISFNNLFRPPNSRPVVFVSCQKIRQRQIERMHANELMPRCNVGVLNDSVECNDLKDNSNALHCIVLYCLCCSETGCLLLTGVCIWLS